MIQTISIQEAAGLLKVKDTRSVGKFCKVNGVPIFSEESSKKKYIIRTQFEYARLKKFIQYLKMKYKEEWLDAFKAYMSMNIINVAGIEEKDKINFILTKDHYKPQGQHEISFLNSLTENIHEL